MPVYYLTPHVYYSSNDANYRFHLPICHRQRERRYEPRERVRIQTLERTLTRERAVKEAENRDRVEMRTRLDVWDDDESDELFYTDRYAAKLVIPGKHQLSRQ